jgi:hypothetical protein
MLHVFTYSTSEVRVQPLLASAKQHGLDIKNLATTTLWNGLQDKLLAMVGCLNGLPSSDIVCFVDAYDVIANCSSNELLARFKAKDTELWIGAEINMDPPTLPMDSFPTSPTDLRFLNSGVYIGYVHAIKNMLSWGDFLNKNDQEYVSEYFLSHQDSVTLDVHASLVLNMFGVPWQTLKIEGGHVYSEDKGIEPCFLHFNGQSYTDTYKDFVDGKFKENGSSTRLLTALVESMDLSSKHDIVCYLTGKGHTY